MTAPNAPFTGTSSVTYVIDSPCTPAVEFWDGEPCEIVRVDHYGMPTPHLMCGPHGEVVGHVIEPD